ncbi:histidine--tRNA ligase [Bacteroidota bacterium]
MSKQKPTLPRGTRDFSPNTMVKRNHILSTIQKVFENYGYLPLETPALENLSVLTGKYGDEGDKLLFKILDSGNFLSKLKGDALELGYKSLATRISEKGLRYDLTVPFARYVVMNQHEIAFPFKRYQMQPVWRADRPQKGRYREFFQCDADVVGTKSLTCEAEIVRMIEDVFDRLKIHVVTRINSRKILEGITEVLGVKGKEQAFYVTIDKFDKIGKEKVLEELADTGFNKSSLKKINEILNIKSSNSEKIIYLEDLLSSSVPGMEGLREIKEVLAFSSDMGSDNQKLEFDIILARGLSYYTGVIVEVKAEGIVMGSIGGGGRYDDLTGVFGLEGLSGVGFSFGIDRIFDVMTEMNLFPELSDRITKVLITSLDPELQKYGLGLLNNLRREGISSEIYPDPVKLKKQLNYANKKGIPFVVLIGRDEVDKGIYTLKNMISGEQVEVDMNTLLQAIK